MFFLPLLPEAVSQIGQFGIRPDEIPCCETDKIQAAVWSGKNPLLTFQQLALYCAPVLWFSPDEPLLDEKKGREIMLPEPFPFEEHPNTPVVYYRVRNLLVRQDATGPATVADSNNRSRSVIDLRQIAGIDLDYFFYYHAEEGLGGHPHDVESAEFKLVVWNRTDCPDCPYSLVVTRAIGKAHGILWYDNTLDVDEYTRFPMHLLVEEGKHATCTDKNGDGYYTPGYDVNKRVNDAWGVRDVMRTGALFTGGFESWMAKVRKEEHRVFPPLPTDSPLFNRYKEDGRYAPQNAIYILRPFPSTEMAEPDLVHFIADKGDPDWPQQTQTNSFEKFQRWAEAESFVKSLSIAFRVDGDLGLSFIFPLFIVKNFEDPLAGGFLVNRIYLKDKLLRDAAWTLLYTSSASRWIDGYFSAGYEWDVEDLPEGSEKMTERNGDVVIETGIKFRVNISHSPVKFLTKVTDFWGIRFGVKNTGFFDVNRISYVFEIGAGTW